MVSSSFCALVIAVCIATIATAVPIQEKIKEHLGKEKKFAHIQRRVPNSNLDSAISCNSNSSNNTIPAAFISGFQTAWGATTDHLYDTHWVCNENDAFVVGGMKFDNSEKKLEVPECGFYHISSQVQFRQGIPRPRISLVPTHTYHQLVVEPNCEDNEPEMVTQAFGTNPTSNLWITSTYTGRVFKLCAGAKISVRVPSSSSNACCPYGNGSFISAHLVKGTDCPHNDE